MNRQLDGSPMGELSVMFVQTKGVQAMRNEHTHSLKMLLRTFKAHEHLGYNAFAVMADGGVLCPYCALSEYRLILSATRSNDRHSGWNYYGCDINWEDTSLYCDHCSGHIPAAYVEDEE